MTEKILTLTPDEDSMLTVKTAVEETMGEAAVPMKTAFKILIVIDEIYSNIVNYSGAAEAEVLCRIDGDTLELGFSDNGIPYDPLVETKEPDTTLGAAERAIGGLGVYIYKKIMDTVKYEYKDGRNYLHLTKSLNPVSSNIS